MKRYFFVLCLTVAAWSCAENFLAKEPAKRRSRGQLKQDITQLMGTLIEQSSLSVEKEAQMQQKLCKEVRLSVEGAKQSRLNTASMQELQQLESHLEREYRRRLTQLAEQDKILAVLK